MKKLSLFAVACLVSYVLNGQAEKEINSTVTGVTVYPEGAQVESEAAVALQQGHMVLKFTGLSPYIRKESIRIDGDGSFIIRNVQHQNDFINELEKSNESETIRRRLSEIQSGTDLEQTWIKILNDKLEFLKTNKEISGKDQSVSPDVFNSMNNIYGSNLEKLYLELLRREQVISDFKKEATKLSAQLASLNGRSDLPSGTIILSLDARQSKTSKIVLKYMVDKAGWEPSYDIRFTGVGKPLTVIFKASITQNTGIDWKDVSLILSTAKTNLSAQIPELAPFWLRFYYPEINRALQGRVAGVHAEEIRSTEPQIMIRGTGSLKSNSNPLYIVDGVPATDVSDLDPNDIQEMKVLKGAEATSLYGSRATDGVILITTKEDREKSTVPVTVITSQEISSEYSVDAPQTIMSNGKINTVAFREISLDASFEYQAVPKLAEHMFLIGRVNDWYRNDLLDGEANIYLENSFVGKSFINTHQFTDTLEISFGVDNNINIKREKLSEYSVSQFIGPNRKETVAFKISVRNNKSYAVKAKITDQIPLSTTKDILVETIDLSGGKYNDETGKVEWSLDLKPDEVKDLVIRYSVRYPKDKKVIIE